MKTLAPIGLVAMSVLLVGLLPVPRPVAPPAARCVAAKMLAAGKAARVRLACVAKATAAGTDEDAGCHGRADERLAAAVARTESKGGCLTTGDAPLLAAAVDACVSGMRAALRPQLQASACTGGKLKAGGATLLGKVRCRRSGVLRVSAPSATCLQKRDGILDAKFAKLDPSASCLTVGDAPQVRALIDQCVAGLMGPIPATTTTSLVAVPTTTTTLAAPTTTSSSTSTSTSVAPGSSTTTTSNSTTTSSSSSSSTSTSSSSSSSSSSSTSTTSTSSTTSTVVYTCGGIFPLCSGTCPPSMVCTGLLCTCQ